VRRQRENFDIIDKDKSERARLKKMSDGLDAIDQSLDKIIGQRNALLVASKKMLAHYEGTCLIPPDQFPEMWRAVRDAIVKAEAP
jgi:phytoene/squalene synthetase